MFNVNYKDDVKYTTKLNRWLLKPIGIWPKPTKSSWTVIVLFRMLNIFNFSLIGFFLLSTTLYIIIDVKDTQVRLSRIGPLIFYVMCMIKYLLMIMHEDDILYCLNHIETDWKNAKGQQGRQIMFECADFSRRLIIISAAFAFGGVIFYKLMIPLISPKIVVGNLTFRPLAIPAPKFIVDARRSPWNEIMIGLQCFGGISMSAITVGCCSMLTISALHACGQLKILMSYLKYLVTGCTDENDNVEERLTNIVKRHVRILRAGKMITQFELQLITLIISFAYNIFIFCYIGEILAEECKRIAEVTYTIDWYQLKGRKSLGLILVIAMSSSSSRLTAEKFIELSISSFSDVVRTSFAYLNMLRAVTS